MFARRNSILRTEDDIAACLSLPVLAQVPLMTTSAERRHARRIRRLLVGCVIAGAIVGLVAAVFLIGSFRS